MTFLSMSIKHDIIASTCATCTSIPHAVHINNDYNCIDVIR